MNRIFLGILFIIFMAFAVPFADAIDVGVSPSVINLGEIERGDTKFVTFHIITGYNKDFYVKLDASPGSIDFFKIKKYSYLLQNYSEEDTTGWVKFISNPVLLKYNPALERGNIKTWRNVDFLLKIPEDAESGVHLLTIKPMPSVQEGMVGINAVVPISILFTVPGEAVRSGKILDVTSYRAGNGITINTFFLNDGTVTISPSESFVYIYNESGDIVKKISQTRGYAKPGEMLHLTGASENIGRGSYTMLANVSYLTGYSTKNTTMKFVSPPTGFAIQPSEKEHFPVWIIVLIFVLVILYIIYKI